MEIYKQEVAIVSQIET